MMSAVASQNSPNEVPNSIWIWNRNKKMTIAREKTLESNEDSEYEMVYLLNAFLHFITTTLEREIKKLWNIKGWNSRWKLFITIKEMSAEQGSVLVPLDSPRQLLMTKKTHFVFCHEFYICFWPKLIYLVFLF